MQYYATKFYKLTINCIKIIKFMLLQNVFPQKIFIIWETFKTKFQP